MIPRYLERLIPVALHDLLGIVRKDQTYQGSWLKRGGVGAFMMLARKWDRLEVAMEANGYNILDALCREGPDTRDGLLDDVRDLRRYLTLVEAEFLSRAEGPVLTVPPLTYPQLDDWVIELARVSQRQLTDRQALGGAPG